MKTIKTDLKFILKTTQNQLIQPIEFLGIPMEAWYTSNPSTMLGVSDSEDLELKNTCSYKLQFLK